MASIDRMERGKLCPMQGGRYHNLQCWERGRNVVRYIPATEVSAVRQAVGGYQSFVALAKKYADQVIRDTRKAAALAKKEPGKAKRKKI